MATYIGIGLMSGSSLDGLDICCAEFTGDVETDFWSYRILKAETIEYSDEWVQNLRDAASLSGAELIKLHVNYGHFLGRAIVQFTEKHKLRDTVQFASSHGHSVFHSPEQGYTFQLGDGETISSHLAFPLVSDFRTKDVALGGQGAPLVPGGEKYLFGTYDICINLGGIANIGIKGQRGFDICPCNLVLNSLAQFKDGELLYDKDGALARSGHVIKELLVKLENLSFYKETPPKSLWKEWIEENVFPLLDVKKYRVEDLLRTATEHIASRITGDCLAAKRILQEDGNPSSVLSVIITGGGAFNEFLASLIKDKLKSENFEFETVGCQTVKFKEALVFAFLGLRCLIGVDNIFGDVTGARIDSASGSIHRPAKEGVSSYRKLSMIH